MASKEFRIVVEGDLSSFNAGIARASELTAELNRADRPTSKPLWALMLGNALDMERQAETIRTEALDIRCDTEDSGGARCTADRLPEHEHRHHREDLP